MEWIVIVLVVLISLGGVIGPAVAFLDWKELKEIQKDEKSREAYIKSQGMLCLRRLVRKG